MNLTESELLQASIGKMSNKEFEEWLNSFYDEGYGDGYDNGYSCGYSDGRD